MGLPLKDEAAAAFHYRCFMLNILVDFGCTYGELCNESEVLSALQRHTEAPPENPNEPWCRWKQDAEAGASHMQRWQPGP